MARRTTRPNPELDDLYTAPDDKPSIAWGLQGPDLEHAITKTFGKRMELAPAASLELLALNPYGLAIAGQRALLAWFIFAQMGGALSACVRQSFLHRAQRKSPQAPGIQATLEMLLFSDSNSLRHMLTYAPMDAAGNVTPMQLPIVSHRSQLDPLALEAADRFDQLALLGQGLEPNHLEDYYSNTTLGYQPLLPEPLDGDLLSGEPFPWHLYLVPPHCPFTLLDDRLWGRWHREQRVRRLLQDGSSQPVLNSSRTTFIDAWERRRALSVEPAVWDSAKRYLLDHAADADTAHRMNLPVANPTTYLERLLAHRPGAPTVIALQQAYSLWAECYSRTAANPSRPCTLHAPWEAAGFLPDAAVSSPRIFGELRSRTAATDSTTSILKWLNAQISDLRHDIDRMPEFLRDSWRGVLGQLIEQRDLIDQRAASSNRGRRRTASPSADALVAVALVVPDHN